MNVEIAARIEKEYKRIHFLELDDDKPGIVFVYYALCKAKFRIGDVCNYMEVSANTIYRWGYGETDPNSKSMRTKLATYIEAIKYGLVTKKLPSKEETLKSILVKYLNECDPVSSADYTE